MIDVGQIIIAAVGLLLAVLFVSALVMAANQGLGLFNKGLSQSTKLVADFDDIDKQKYDGMTVMGDQVVEVIKNFWDDPTCEVLVCTLDGVNAVYNVESSDGTYTVPISEVLTGMPTADSKGRVFPTDATIYDIASVGVSASSYTNPDTQSTALGGVTYDVATFAQHNITNGAVSGQARIADAAALVQSPGTNNLVLATLSGYNTLCTVGSGGYISTSAPFVGSVQKDANGVIRRITFVQQ